MESSEADDIDLLRRWTSGDRRAGEQLIARHRRAVLGVLRRQLCRDVDDTLQETLLAVLASAPRFRALSSFRSFALGTAYNQARAERRRRARASKLMLSLDHFEEPQDLEHNGSFSEQRSRTLDAAIIRLKADKRRLLDLSFWRGLTHAEIACSLGIPAGTVSTRLRRTYVELQGLFTELDDDSGRAGPLMPWSYP